MNLLKQLKNYSPVLLAMVLLFSLSNCTVTKRQYRSGYHVNWHKNLKTDKSGAAEKVLVSETVKPSKKDKKPVVVAAIPEESVETYEEPNKIIQAEDVTVESIDQILDVDDKQEINQSRVKTTIPEDEPEPDVSWENERVIPIWLGIIILVLSLQLVLGITAGIFLLPAIILGEIGFLVGGAVALIFLTGAIFLYFLMFSREKTIYASKRERNMYYLLFSVLIALIPIGLIIVALYAFF